MSKAKTGNKKPIKAIKPTKPTRATKPTPRAAPARPVPARAAPAKAAPTKPTKAKKTPVVPAKADKPVQQIAMKDRKEAIKQKANQARQAKKAVAADDAQALDRFWVLIERSRRGSDGDTDTQMGNLERLLVDLPADEILNFQRSFSVAVRDAFRWDLWAVAYIINGGCSDDGFDYFLGWLIARGRKHYEKALVDPQRAADGLDEGDVELADIWSVAARAWAKKTGRTSDDFYALDPSVSRELKGEPFDEDTIYDRHPKLAEKFS